MDKTVEEVGFKYLFDFVSHDGQNVSIPIQIGDDRLYYDDKDTDFWLDLLFYRWLNSECAGLHVDRKIGYWFDISEAGSVRLVLSPIRFGVDLAFLNEQLSWLRSAAASGIQASIDRWKERRKAYEEKMTILASAKEAALRISQLGEQNAKE